jgi:hypothetical protein
MNKDERIEELFTEMVKSELKEVDTGEMFGNMLDECYSFDVVGGPFAMMSPSRVLAEVDPTAYRCGESDYVDSELGETLEEVDGCYYHKDEVDRIREEAENSIEAIIEDEEAEEEEEDEEDED